MITLYVLVDTESDYPVSIQTGGETYLDFLAPGEEIDANSYPELEGVELEGTVLMIAEGMERELSGQQETYLNTNESVIAYFYRRYENE